MLNAKTYGDDITFMNHFKKEGVKPDAEYCFQKCIDRLGLKIKPYALWYYIIVALDDNDLLNAQYDHCKDDLIDNQILNKKDLEKLFTEHLKEFNDNQGDFIVKEHYLTDNVICPIQKVSIEQYHEIINNKKCFICETSTDSLIIDKVNKEKYPIIAEKVLIHDNITLEKDSSSTLYPIDDFNFKVDSFSINNHSMIMDALNTMKMTIFTSDEFKNKSESKYPFLKDMANVCLAGGFCRSIILNQKLKDFDFFLYGLDDPMPRFKKLVNDIITSVKKHYPKYNFAIFFKPLFNVFELVAYEDPTNLLTKEDFCLDKFDEYKYNSLKRFKSGVSQDENYFEDGDDHGIYMKHRFQIIMCKFESKEAIINNFDLEPSKVLYDGERVLMNKKCYEAYKYMINVINPEKYTYLFEYRISKYFSYGFSIVNHIPKKINNNGSTRINVGNLKFDVININNNKITIAHNSHIQELLDGYKKMEQENNDKGKALYKSSLFCSFVSLLRYVKINNINYSFIENVDEFSFEDNSFNFKTGKVTLEFIEKIQASNNIFSDKNIHSLEEWKNTLFILS